jgi:hypothetical protein
MSTIKQVSTVKMGVYIYNGGYRAFSGYPVSLPVWNVNFQDKADFLTSPVTRSLNGFERGNPMGWRTKVDVFLDNSMSANSSTIRALMSLMSSQYARTFFTTTVGTVTGNTIVITNGVQTNNFYNGLIAVNDTLGQSIQIVSYVGSSRVATLASAPTGWVAGNNMRVVARSNYPTVLGVSLDNTDANVVYCNLLDGSFGIERQLTVGKQVIQLSLTEVERKQNIDDKLRIT